VKARVRIALLAVALVVATACAVTATRPISPGSPSQRLSIPRIVTSLWIANRSGWVLSHNDEWEHLKNHAREVYLHGGKLYVMVQGKSDSANGTLAPYLVAIKIDARAQPLLKQLLSRARAGSTAPAYPPTGVGIIQDVVRLDNGRTTELGIDPSDLSTNRLDMTFEDRKRTEVLSDYSGPKAVAVYALGCEGCALERPQLRVLATRIAKLHGVLVIVTPGQVERVRRELLATGVSTVAHFRPGCRQTYVLMIR